MKKTFKLLPAGCAIALAAIYMVSASAQTPASEPEQSPKMRMDTAAPMSTDQDKNFAMMMKMHHQKGIEMAQKELANGKSTEMKAMAKKIIAAQTKEIADFDQWLAQQK